MNKLLIKNISRAYGFTDSCNTPFSILIDEDGDIAEYAEAAVIQDGSETRVIDAAGLCISPGWIDLHTHVYRGVCDIALDPDLAGPCQGVAAMADAGSAGHITFPGFRDYVIKNREYEIYAFLNLGSAGIIRCNVIGDYETDDFIEPDKTLTCIEENRNYIKGLKLRACKVVLKGRLGMDIVRLASDTARSAGLPLMVHIGEPGPELGDILNTLRSGDIVTHCFHGKPRGILSSDNGPVIKEARAARDRGVLFDLGHGAGSFSFLVGKEAIKQGFKPDIISTDLHGWDYPEPVTSLWKTMSKMISCGLDTEEVINKVTQAPAQALNLDQERLSLKPGTKARLTLFRIEEQQTTYYDVLKYPIDTRIQIVPVMTIIGSSAVECISNA